MLSTSPIKFYIKLSCLFVFFYWQLGTTAHAAIGPKKKVAKTTTNYKTVKKISPKKQRQIKKKLRKKIGQTKRIGTVGIILISVSVLMTGLVLGAIFTIPALWITCLALLVLALLAGVFLVLLMMGASYGC